MSEREKALEAALLSIRELNMTAEDENGLQWANSDLIEQEIVAALAMPATVDVACSVILSDIEDALPRWIEAMGNWDRGGEQSIDEMEATLEDIRNLTPPEDAP
jgi:hypothetical protein